MIADDCTRSPAVVLAYVQPYPPPVEKTEGGNVYEELAQIVLCDVTEIYASYVNKLYFPRKCVSTRVLAQTKAP